MHHRKTIACAAATALVGSALAVGPASAATKTLTIKGGEKFVPGKGVSDNQRFSPSVITLKKGDTIKVVEKTGHEHTISTVSKRDLPKSFADTERPVFGKYFEAHGVPEGEGPPAFPQLDAFLPVTAENPLIFDELGDSTLIQGKQKGLELEVGASKGTNLHYLCLIHPWMQGRIQVR